MTYRVDIIWLFYFATGVFTAGCGSDEGSSQTCERLCDRFAEACKTSASGGEYDRAITDCLADCEIRRVYAKQECSKSLDEATACVGSAIDWDQVRQDCSNGGEAEDALDNAIEAAAMRSCLSEYSRATECIDPAFDATAC